MPKTILVVDDSATARNLVLLNLKKLEDVRVVTAKDGEEALTLLRAEPADLIVSDVNMPKMDGYAFVDAVRKSGDAKTPIILLTTKGEDQDVNHGLQLGATAYLTKPINGMELVETIRRLMG